TPRSATAALDRLRPLVERVRETHLHLERFPSPPREGDQPVSAARFTLLIRHRQLVAGLRRQGVEVQDGRAGKIRFPACRRGRRVWLIWTLGEDGVRHWSEADEG
ncbi:MAG: DUF2203 domain-containing protein, partial [Acidobacteriota bacterium]|nr:DUF2203 domain-containing protein [Acidobacteriota bacterium]